MRLVRNAYWRIACSRRRASQECLTEVVVSPTHRIATRFRFGLSGGIKNGAHTFQNKMPVWKMCDTRTDTCTHACALSLARTPELSVSPLVYLSLSISISRSLSIFAAISLHSYLSFFLSISLALDLSRSVFLSIFLSLTNTHTHTHRTHTHTWRWFVQRFFKACYYDSVITFFCRAQSRPFNLSGSDNCWGSRSDYLSDNDHSVTTSSTLIRRFIPEMCM
jgi:hypothetical protein